MYLENIPTVQGKGGGRIFCTMRISHMHQCADVVGSMRTPEEDSSSVVLWINRTDLELCTETGTFRRRRATTTTRTHPTADILFAMMMRSGESISNGNFRNLA